MLLLNSPFTSISLTYKETGNILFLPDLFLCPDKLMYLNLSEKSTQFSSLISL